MLNSPSDYDFVDVSNVGSFIRGRPLPVRYTSSSSSGTAICAYEDYLYLLEAHNERLNLEQDGQNNVQPASQIVPASAVNATRWTRTVGQIGSVGSTLFINKNSTYPTTLAQLPTPDSLASAAIQNMGITLYGQDSIRSESLRNLDIWCRKFYGYHQLTRGVKNMSGIGTNGVFANFTGTTTRRLYRSGGETSDTTETFNFNGVADGWSYYYATTSNTETIYTPHITKMSTLKMPYAKSATMLVRGRLMVDGTYIAAYSYPVEMDVSDGNISMNSLTWVQDITRSILQKHGYEYVTDFKGKASLPETNSSIVVYVGEGYLIVDFDFPADYNSWNWQPS